jgi:hypothetical protein
MGSGCGEREEREEREERVWGEGGEGGEGETRAQQPFRVRRAAVDAVRDSRGGGLRGQGDALVAYGDALVA